jgi:hypothetical protein
MAKGEWQMAATSPQTMTKPRARWGLVAVGLLGVVALAHGPSLWDGLFFDDHWHRTTLREYGWGFGDLTESATFDLPGRLTHLWWQEQPLQWRYARPAAMLFMKLEYVLSGGNPVAVHAFALLWHWATVLLVYRLALWGLRSSGWAFVAAGVFAINPHSVFAVSWIAARNALVSGFFFVAAVLAYVRASFQDRAPRGGRWNGWLPAALVLWGLALFSRETAIIFPAILVVLDLAFGGWRHAWRRWPVYLLVGMLSAVYLYWRLFVFPQHGVPDIYFTAPSGLAYLPWAASKLLHLLFSQIFYTPMFLGLATYGSSATHIGAYVVMTVLVGLIGLWYTAASRGVTGRWVWPAWTVLAFVPVIPVFVMAHFSYLPAIAYAVVVAILLKGLRGRWRPVITVLVLAAMAWSHFLYRTIWRGIVRSEQLIYADILAENPTLPAAAKATAGAKLFFIDLPVAGIYAPVALRAAWGVHDLEGYVLTFAPHPLMMRSAATLQQLNDRELLVSTEPPGYFAGLAGRMLEGGMRPGHPLAAGTFVPGADFDTRVVAGDDAGVTALRFTFHAPLSSAAYLFFVSTPERPAARVRFDLAAAPLMPAPPSEAWQKEYAGWLAARDWYFRIVDIAARVFRSDVLLTSDSKQAR